jgi:hypothetical protein
MKDYDTTVARIAGNILSTRAPIAFDVPTLTNADRNAVAWAVSMACAIVDEVRARGQRAVDAARDADVQTTRQWLDDHARIAKT